MGLRGAQWELVGLSWAQWGLVGLSGAQWRSVHNVYTSFTRPHAGLVFIKFGNLSSYKTLNAQMFMLLFKS